jgi:diguanylate cyclase (GGDEF)-like protein
MSMTESTAEKSGINSTIPAEINQKSEEVIRLEAIITELKRENAELREKAFTDELTGIYNRSFGEEELKRQCLSRKDVSVAFIDIKDFKIINDFWNYEKGDEFIKKIASGLKGIIRPTDSVVRWGGDEFVLILPDCDEEQKNIIEKRVKKVGDTNGLGLSFGFATKKSGETYKGNDVDKFVKKVEDNMNSTKTESSREKIARVYS